MLAIVGLGQIGSSLGAALIRRRLEPRVVGIVRRAAVRKRALDLRCAHEVTTDLGAVSEADVVVLATPARTILRQIPQVARLMKAGALLTDVGSTKAEIMRAARGLRFIGGHPMAGHERAGLDGCDPDLFARRPWILIPSNTLPAHVTWAERTVAALGARPVWMKDPAAHDAAVAAISHVPYLAAYAFMQVDDRAFAVAGNSFRDATRVAASDVDMVLDFLLTNRRAIAGATRDFVRRLQRLAGAVRRGDERALRQALEAARRRRAQLNP